MIALRNACHVVPFSSCRALSARGLAVRADAHEPIHDTEHDATTSVISERPPAVHVPVPVGSESIAHVGADAGAGAGAGADTAPDKSSAVSSVTTPSPGDDATSTTTATATGDGGVGVGVGIEVKGDEEHVEFANDTLMALEC